MTFKSASLTPTLLHVLQDKGTEAPFIGAYTDFDDAGTYLCRQCGLALFRAQGKFHSGCGWPSFDAEISGAVTRQPDDDGRRTEIVCARCAGHLGHVFSGEGYTAHNIRHCVNSLSMDFVADTHVLDTQEAIFAGGCFWGVDYYFKRLPGVLKVEVGYSGGHRNNPVYEQVCTGQTGHLEVVRVVFDIKVIDYAAVTRYFLEIHDPAQADGQGPDIGAQYQSAIFYYDANQRQIAENLLQQLRATGIKPATQLLPVAVFWPAEHYHQDYYQKNAKAPYCHQYVKRF